ncbi:DUF4397 domain-containing protein [Shewanella sp. GutDb-MelDb]|jgi:uncharacterized protein YqkB|uniref:DUF4397 domain-containing protein n=1 Tax=Shewanella sp. GutDb-MelDb TaxID=2058316 RepID=UPI000C7CE4B4|nr:DUF4397 domain-containing protein [Shewanella sp. GutDb-MelDb]PKG56305.1 hypothetical protein CXF82_15525 [Shewanella sp. GutDb-MelDb]
MNFTPRGITCLFLALATAVGCSSDDDSDSSSEAYIQYYNASPNSTATALVLDGYQYTAVSYADAQPRYVYNTGSSEMEVIGTDELGDELSLYSSTLSLSNDDEHFFVLLGDYGATELLDIQYDRSEMDELNMDESDDYSKMQMLVMHAAMDEPTYDVYFGLDGEDFSGANMLDSLSYKDHSSELMFDTGEYVLYLTQTGQSTPIYTTATLDLTANTVYKFVIRNSFGPGTPKLTIDAVDSTGSPTQYANIDANAEYRVFNALNSVDNIDIAIASNQETQYLYELGKHSLSDFKTIGYNDYGVTITNKDSNEVLANNLLVTFNQDESKSILVYEDELGMTKGMTLTHDHRPRAFTHKIDLANLVFDYETLTIYFVKSTETIESAKYKITDFEFTELESISIESGEYEINVVFEDENETLTLLYQSEPLFFDSAGNYTMVLNKDDTQPLGYRLILF